ncbi:helix-turn-helix domain-containing protein [Herbaspirillum lusitanum]|uniref:Helix-turn-helix domain-containing protein n=1 Tax=Herbaspirillum lusitanum TaxID=213312 RepID=A0ABW9A7A8_9BURK
MVILIEQLYISSICIRFHTINERLAKWLLMNHDRLNSNAVDVTQEFISLMLGVRRVGITAAATSLREMGLIEYSRGRLTILDRKKLEAVACDCYAEELRIYKEIL